MMNSISNHLRDLCSALSEGDVVKKPLSQPHVKRPRRELSIKNKSNRTDYMKNYMEEYREDGKDYQKVPEKVKEFRRKQRKKHKKRNIQLIPVSDTVKKLAEKIALAGV